MKTTLTAALLLALTGAAAVAQTPPVQHVRGTISKLDGDMLDLKVRGGQDMMVKLTPDVAVTGVFAAKLSDIKPGTFIGTAAAPQPDGSLKALEVTVFPAGMHGGEGSYGWDLTPTSTMTNGTVGALETTSGRTMSVKYPTGEKQVTVPDDVPVVSFHPADRSKLVPGAHVFFTPTKAADGTMTASRINVGENGLVPPT